MIEEKLRGNIWKALNQKHPSILQDNNGKEIAEFRIGQLFSIENGRINVNFGPYGLKRHKNFVGLGHILYNPLIFGARNIDEVLFSWRWLIKRIRVSEKVLQRALESCSLMMLLLSGHDKGETIYIFSFFVDLYNLDLMGINTNKKLIEFGIWVTIFHLSSDSLN